MRPIIMYVGALLLLPFALERTAAAEIYAIEGATVIARPDKTIENANVILQGGKISAVGKGVAIPRGAKKIDGRGLVVSAGLIEASARIGMVEVDAVADTTEGSFGGGANKDVVHAAYRVTDAYNPDSIAIPIALSGGVTSAVVVPSGGLISGTSAWMRLVSGGGKLATLTVKKSSAMHAAGGAHARVYVGEGGRGVALERLREILFDAEVYRRERQRYERNQTRTFVADRLDLEALFPVLDGTLPLVISADRSADITALLTLREERPRLKLVIAGGTEAWRVAGELARARVPVILDPTQNLPNDFDRAAVRNDNARLLCAAGVEVAVSALGEWANVRNLRQLAGVGVAYGLTRQQALASITTVPARIFGVAELGTVEAGKGADIVLWSGDPLEITTRVVQVFVAGAPQSQVSRQSLLFERYRTLPPRN